MTRSPGQDRRGGVRWVWGAYGPPAPLRLVLDTGAAETIIVPAVLDELGYEI